MRRYFKAYDQVAFFGVKLPDVRRAAREVALSHREWDVGAATAFCDTMVRRPELEAKSVGILVLARHARAFRPGLLATARGWLARGHCATWAAVDLLAPSVLTPLVDLHAPLAGRVATWTTARSLWVRRAAAVTFVPFARKGRHLDRAYAIARALFPDTHDLIHKATGWLLREAGKTDPERLEGFLRAHGPAIPRTTVRYALERFAPATRRRLLEATR
jgi:3-methyladenine DNA glycosylase AlkD